MSAEINEIIRVLQLTTWDEDAWANKVQPVLLLQTMIFLILPHKPKKKKPHKIIPTYLNQISLACLLAYIQPH